MATATFNPPSGGSGTVRRENTTNWADVRDDATGDSVDIDTDVELEFEKDGTKYICSRLFFPFDISSLPSNINVSAASLTINGTETGDITIGLTESTQASPTTLATSHYNDLTLDSPVELATRIDGSANVFTFNANGLSLIETLRSTQTQYIKLVVRSTGDIDNSSPSAINNKTGINSNTAELSITYSIRSTDDTQGYFLV